jgi:hypothetical protein
MEKLFAQLLGQEECARLSRNLQKLHARLEGEPMPEKSTRRSRRP